MNTILNIIKKFFARLLAQVWQIVFGLKRATVWEEARKIIDGIKKHKLWSTYSHDNIVDTTQGSYRVDCSGYVNEVLKKSLPTALNEVQAFVNRCSNIPKPRTLDPWPVHFVLFFNARNLKNWQVIEDARSLWPGDIVAYYSEYEKDLSSERGQHIMIVADPITTDYSNHTRLWVPIFDSTKIPHGKKDIREPNGGIGQGVIGLELDGNGNPIKLRWSRDSNTSLTRKIAMARIITQ